MVVVLEVDFALPVVMIGKKNCVGQWSLIFFCSFIINYFFSRWFFHYLLQSWKNRHIVNRLKVKKTWWDFPKKIYLEQTSLKILLKCSCICIDLCMYLACINIPNWIIITQYFFVYLPIFIYLFLFWSKVNSRKENACQTVCQLLWPDYLTMTCFNSTRLIIDCLTHFFL